MKLKVAIDKLQLDELAEMLKALGHPSRISIMWLLCHNEKGKMTVKCIYEILKMPQPIISRHLGVLRAASLITRSVTGQQTFYEPCNSNKYASKIVSCFKTIN